MRYYIRNVLYAKKDGLEQYIRSDSSYSGRFSRLVMLLKALTFNKNGLEDNEVKWNFQKYLINTQGKLERVVGPRVKPMDASIIEWIRTK